MCSRGEARLNVQHVATDRFRLVLMKVGLIALIWSKYMWWTNWKSIIISKCNLINQREINFLFLGFRDSIDQNYCSDPKPPAALPLTITSTCCNLWKASEPRMSTCDTSLHLPSCRFLTNRVTFVILQINLNPLHFVHSRFICNSQITNQVLKRLIETCSFWNCEMLYGGRWSHMQLLMNLLMVAGETSQRHFLIFR